MSLSLGMGLGLTMVPQVASESDPAEWGGLTPLVDWNPANAVLSGSDITSIPNAEGLDTHTLSGVAAAYPTIVASSAHFNGAPAVAHSGASAAQRFTFTDLGATTNGPVTFVFVATVLSDSAGANYLLSTTADEYAFLGQPSQNRWEMWLSDNGVQVNSDNDPDDPAIIVGTLGGGVQRLYVNSTTQEGQAASSGADFGVAGNIGNYINNSAVFNFNGQWARILVFAGVDWITTDGPAELAALYGISL